ncbi:hypothetical protein PIB30_002697 [Stylosanthes scabra]|uniref:Uncharacterized protein n=1 Tax=Stylosanthes scabra TaxID=79078 RepID=A0ABU6R5C8_9FABA|nr:hypothetical protein [Stylosanthes scabra]
MKKKIREQAKGNDDSSSRELPTIVEDEVNGVNNQNFWANHELVLSKLRENASEVSTKAATSLAEGKLPASETRPLKRKLDFVDLTNDDTTILHLIRQRGIGSPFTFYHHKGLVMLGEETPKVRMNTLPPEGMRFDGDDLAIVVFIFASGMEESERLVEDSHFDGSRKRLLSLLPGAQLFYDVINMVVGMWTSQKVSSLYLWLPTTFLSEEMSASTMEYIKDRYMGLADDLLMPIDDSTRMRIAMQLVVGPHNLLVESVTENAVKFWNSEMVRNYKEEAEGGPVPKGPPRSNSPNI